MEIEPTLKFLYPDRGGYTGFSIHVWETNRKNLDDYLLVHEWGKGVWQAAELPRKKFALEARFFVFGSLLDRVLISRNFKRNIYSIANKIYEHWKPIMDSIKMTEAALYSQPNRNGIHIDEIINSTIRKSVKTKWSSRVI